MFTEETLRRKKNRQYEEPEGEFLELIGKGSNTITVLTRVEEAEESSDKGPVDISEDLPDPSNYSVADLEAELKEKVQTEGLSVEQRKHLIHEEESGKNRKTAITAIKEA